MFKAKLHKIQGGSAIQNMQQQHIIDYYVNQFAQVQPPYSFSDKRPKPWFPVAEDSVMNQHWRAVEMSQQSKQQPAPSSSNDPESAHEPKGSVGRPRKDHEVPTETRTYPLWWNAQPVGKITSQLFNMGWRKHDFEHFTQKGDLPKRLTK